MHVLTNSQEQIICFTNVLPFFFPPKKETKVFHMVTVALFCLEFVEEFSSIGSCSTASTRHFIN